MTIILGSGGRFANIWQKKKKNLKFDAPCNPATLLEVNPLKGHLILEPSHNAMRTGPPRTLKVRCRSNLLLERNLPDPF